MTIQNVFEDYWQVGGFPGANGLDERRRIEAHQANWNTILASIIRHHNISHPRAMTDLAHWLVDNNGSYYSVSHLTDYMKSFGHRVRKSSVVDWLAGFEDVGLLFSVNIFSDSPTRISSASIPARSTASTTPLRPRSAPASSPTATACWRTWCSPRCAG